MDESISERELPKPARAALRSLPKGLADKVARHLVAAGDALAEEPALALEHARWARHNASRVGVVREANGIAAYHAGEWAEALSELRAAYRMVGGSYLAIMADCERGLGRPQRALDLAATAQARELEGAERVELLIVQAGARRDMGENAAAVVTLQVAELHADTDEEWAFRLRYSHADNLHAAGRDEEAKHWFAAAARVDRAGQTDAAQRAQEPGAGLEAEE